MDMKWNFAIFVIFFLIIFLFKCCGIFDWSWVWVFSPLWIAAGIFGLEWLVHATEDDWF